MCPGPWPPPHPPRPSRPPRRTLSAALALALAGSFAGCGGPRSLELVGGELSQRLPAEVMKVIPADAVLCLDEDDQEGAYHIWILRKPGGTWIEFPKRKRIDFEHHSMPPTALETILESKLPSLNRGQPLERRCRYTHWRGEDGDEFQVRELVTDQGWFGSVERVRP